MGGEKPRSRSVPAADAAASTNVRVVCRLRPMSEREKQAGTTPAVSASSGRSQVAVLKKVGGSRQARSSFHFDEVLSSCSTQAQTFAATLGPLVEDVLAGYETTAFAYGQTGTGKTHTMEGDAESEEGQGLMPRAAAAVLDALSTKEYTEHSVTLSYLEIYNEELSDLLAPANYQPKLELMESGSGVCCKGLSELPVKSLKDIQDLIQTAKEQKRIAETRVNARSSRSHCIFTMKVRCRKRVAGGELENFGKLHLVDLAGSECAKKAGWGPDETPRRSQVGSSAEQERERKNINQSLLTLGRVIAALRDKTGRVPYRDSKLTRLLKDALGGSCKTVIIATISPALSAVDETVSTLTYAEQASAITNKVACSSLLRSGRPISEARGDGRSEEWEELEMKIDYLTQELEEAQVALARSYQEKQPIIERAEVAEAKLVEADAKVTAAQSALVKSNAVRTQMATSAKEVASKLTLAANSVALERDAIARELHELKQQRAEEEQLVTLLRQQRETLQIDVSAVQAALDSAKGDLDTTRAEIARLKVDQSEARSKALEAIIAYATREMGNLGHDLDNKVDTAVGRLDHGGVFIGEASKSMVLAESHSTEINAKAQDVASAWSQRLVVNCGELERRTGDLSETTLNAVSAAASRLEKLEVSCDMTFWDEQNGTHVGTYDVPSEVSANQRDEEPLTFENGKENSARLTLPIVKAGTQKTADAVSLTSASPKSRMPLRPIN